MSPARQLIPLLLCLASCRSRPAIPDPPGAPSPGLYRCWSGGFDHLPAGTLTLNGLGHYESYRPRGGGSYLFSPSSSTLEFLDGDYHHWEYRGIFQPASRSSDHRERLVLTPISSTSPIGAERPGEYQYCYPEPGPAAPPSNH